MVQSATDSSIVRPIVPPKLRSGIGRTVRSGLNLPIASASESLSAAVPCLSVWATDFASEPGERLLHAPAAGPRRTSAMIAAVPGGSASPILSWSPVSTLWWANLPTTAPPAAPTTVAASSGGAARPTRKPTAAAPARALAAEMVAGLLHDDAAVGVVGDQDRAPMRTVLVHRRDEGIEVPGRAVDVPVARDEDVRELPGHSMSVLCYLVRAPGKGNDTAALLLQRLRWHSASPT